MFAEIDYYHQECIADTKNWGCWITEELDLKGFRLDAAKHFPKQFIKEWVKHLRKRFGEDLFIAAEFWTGEVLLLVDWLTGMGENFSCFDAPLVYNFHHISIAEKSDLRTVFDNSLVQAKPENAVVSLYLTLIKLVTQNNLNTRHLS
jgi:alpha-amylase